ncbi:SWIM zinc finger family protein [Streptomyces sp. NPDC030592]|uniref:SWIM zinc finger family protein n=1 Tax=Streptomyces sp. NPDC030592 TaxID=3155365 RepID=UPI00340CDC82
MTPGPADEARRALREARERGEGTGAGREHGPASPAPAPSAPSAQAQGQEGAPGGKPTEPTEPRAGDAARAALRRARHAEAHDPGHATDTPSHRSNPAEGVEPGEPAQRGEGGDRSGDLPPSTAPVEESRSGAADGGDSRPADVAREALRAARRQAKAAAASGGAAHARRAPRPAGRQRRAGGTGTADARARAVRDFVADAFRLPSEADPPEETSPAGRTGESLPADKRADRTSREVRAALSSPEAVSASGVGPAVGSGPVGSGEEGAALSSPAAASSSGVGPAVGSGPAGSGEDRVAASSPGPPPSPGPAPSPESAPARHPAPAPEPTPPPGVGPVTGAGVEPAAVSPRAGHAPRSEGSASDRERPEGPRRPEQPSAVRDRDADAAHPAPPARPRAPRSMGAPGRDGELRRTFPALPPRNAADEGLAGTWWGNAWVTALEEGALDPARLERGRGYAERGRVDAITVTPGLVLAYVQGSRARPYRVQVRLRTLGDADWDRFLDAAVERPGHIAALLDKELPHSLADLADRGVPLLPGPGDLTPQCSCPDSGHPCKHAAALCYQTARLLDADPFVLLLLRGRGERTLLDALSRRNAARAARAAQERGPAPLPGVRAGEALARRLLPPLPAPLPAPPHPEQPPAYPAAPGGPDPFALDQLATDAAARAHALLTTGRDPVGGLTLWQDAVRLAAARPGSGLTAGTRALYASLASAAGRDTAELARAVAAWRQGGPEGLDVLEEPWDPPAGRFDRARPLLLAADLPAFRPWRNRLTHPRGHVQLRLGRAGLWYAYESEPDREDWWPRGTPDLDPVGALTGLGTRVDL